MIDQKTFHLQFTKGIIDQKLPTFNVPIYPYKTYIFYCYETFLSGTCQKSSLSCTRFEDFWSPRCHKALFESLFSFGQCRCLQFGFTKLLYIFNHTKCTFISYILDQQNIPLFCTFLDLQNVPLISTFLDLQNIPLFSMFLDQQNVPLFRTFLDFQNVQWIIVHKT